MTLLPTGANGKPQMHPAVVWHWGIVQMIMTKTLLRLLMLALTLS
jgi:hypothetical protein